MEYLVNTLAVGLVLGLLVFIHEFGHYAAAKLCGVRVEVFSIGFGKRLLGFKRNETDYRLSVLPLGGYVKMSGENPFEASTGDPGEFMSHPRWQRFIIAIAGPFMNVLLAVAVMTGINMVHFAHPDYEDQPAVIGWIQDNSPADKAKLEVGDKIVKLEGIKNPSWEQIEPREAMSAGQPLHLQIQRGERLFDQIVVPVAVDKDQRGQVGWEPSYSNTLAALEPGMPAANAGLKVGDEIKSLDNVIVRSNSAVISFLQNNKEKPVQVTYVRDGKESTTTVTPVLMAAGNDKKYRMGVSLQAPMHYDKLPFGQALVASLKWNRENSLLIFEMLKKLAQQPRTSIHQVSSPLGMAPVLGDQVRQGSWFTLLFLTALISLNLGIFNLLPIPILDGGLILLLFIEGTLRRDIKREIKERIYQVAFVFIVLFAVVVIFNDVAKSSIGHTLHLSSLVRVLHLG
jgi:regulator of sigma E protease